MDNSELKSLNVPQDVIQEIEDFATEVERLTTGELDIEDFKRFRLQQGIYGQRQEDEQMVRTKLPFGQMSADQMRCLAEFGEKYSNGILHVTTRQDIQFHFVKIKTVTEALALLAKHDLTSREACGNTVRNVTACHKTGTCPEELFDVTPYAQAVMSYLIRHPLTQSLPRKFKITFGGCNGCGLAAINDIGLNAREQNGKRGFRMVIGGGLGSYPRSAQPLFEFLPIPDMLRTCEAMVAVFDKYGDKKNRNKARFKFIIERLGMDKTRELILEEFEKLADRNYPEILAPDEVAPEIPQFEDSTEFDQDPEFKAWVARNTFEQRQKGFYNVHIKLLLGDLNTDQAHSIADISSKFAGSKLVNTVHQNIMISWVRQGALGHVYRELKILGLHRAGTEELKDMTSCPGSETCNLGITHSRGLIDQLSEDVDNEFTEDTDLDHITIKASGCPNSCGQHHIAAIGFSGSARKVNGILAPHYEVMLGGRIIDDKATFGETVIKIPAKNAPNAVRRLIDDYKKVKEDEESFLDYYDRLGKKYFGTLLGDLKKVPPIEDSPQSYIDYHSSTRFSLDDRGQGECAGAISELISDHISEGERALFQCKKLLEKGDLGEAVTQAQRAFICCARGMMHTEGIDFTDNLLTIQKFESLIVDSGIVNEKHSGIAERYEAKAEGMSKEQAQSYLVEAGSLVAESKEAYLKMKTQGTLRIRVENSDDDQSKGHTPTRDTFFDVTKNKHEEKV